MNALWPHQQRAIDELERLDNLAQRGAVVVTSPTGGGKRRIIVERARRAARQGGRVVIFTNRKLLTGQTADELKRSGIEHGVIAAGHDHAIEAHVQVASVQTFVSRVLKRESLELPPADLVMIDEAHSIKAAAGAEIIARYASTGAAVEGYTATPVGLAGLYQRLVVAGNNSELRRCGALVPCKVFAPSEPDMKGVKMNKVGEYVQAGAVKRIMQCTVFGDVFDTWKRLNPDGYQTILFAPGIPESRWFVGELEKRGVSAAHIDGETPEEERQEIIRWSQEGSIQIVSSYGVLREGVDMPWIRHGILCQPCGALSTFLQVAGRLLRACPAAGKAEATLQDHAGAWHRHGSPNADRVWRLDGTDKAIARALKEARQAGDLPEPICCPKCSGIRSAGPRCPHCGYEHVRSVRMVRMQNGELKKVQGDTVRRKQKQSADQTRWDSCLWAAAKSGRTVSQAAAHFVQATGARPAGLKNLPERNSEKWHWKVADLCPWMGRKGVPA